MTSVSVDDGIWNAAKQFPNHISFMAFWNRVKGFLYDMAAEWVHAEGDDIAVYSISNSNDLVGRAMLETSLNEKVTEAVDHQRVCLVDNGFDDLELLLSCANLEFLLKEDGGLLIVVADDLVDNVFPVTGYRLVK